jgi:hypothetical protein
VLSKFQINSFIKYKKDILLCEERYFLLKNKGTSECYLSCLCHAAGFRGTSAVPLNSRTQLYGLCVYSVVTGLASTYTISFRWGKISHRQRSPGYSTVIRENKERSGTVYQNQAPRASRVEHVPSKCEALSSNPNTDKKTKQTKTTVCIVVFCATHLERFSVKGQENYRFISKPSCSIKDPPPGWLAPATTVLLRIPGEDHSWGPFRETAFTQMKLMDKVRLHTPLTRSPKASSRFL